MQPNTTRILFSLCRLLQSWPLAQQATAAKVLFAGALYTGAILATLIAPARAAYIFTNVADNTTAAPVGTYGYFANPSVSGSTAAFLAGYNGFANEGIFTGSGGSITTIAKKGDAAPVGTFSGLSEDVALSGSRAAFVGFYDGGANSGVFTGSGGALTTIVKTGDAAPIGTFSGLNAEVGLSGSRAAFLGSYNGGANSGIFSGSGGPLTTIAKTGDAAPDGTFFDFGFPSISGSTAAFVGSYPFGNGVFTGSGGALTTIVKTGDAAAVGTFDGLYAPALSGSTAAFIGVYNNLDNWGIFTGSGGAVTTIVKTGDVAPVGTFDDFGDPSISGSTAAFAAYYNGGANLGIFTGSGGPISTVIRQGDSLFGSTVTVVVLDRFGVDANSLAFRYTLADGRIGVAVATQVPEPSAFVLAGLGLAGGVVLLRRRAARARLCTSLGARH